MIYVRLYIITSENSQKVRFEDTYVIVYCFLIINLRIFDDLKYEAHINEHHTKWRSNYFISNWNLNGWNRSYLILTFCLVWNELIFISTLVISYENSPSFRNPKGRYNLLSSFVWYLISIIKYYLSFKILSEWKMKQHVNYFVANMWNEFELKKTWKERWWL